MGAGLGSSAVTQYGYVLFRGLPKFGFSVNHPQKGATRKHTHTQSHDLQRMILGHEAKVGPPI